MIHVPVEAVKNIKSAVEDRIRNSKFHNFLLSINKMLLTF